LREAESVASFAQSRQDAKFRKHIARFSRRLYFSPHPSYFLFMTKCPTCGKPVDYKDNPWRPFCAERCKLIDFDKWTSEEYRVPGQRINPAEMPEQPAARDNDEDNSSNV